MIHPPESAGARPSMGARQARPHVAQALRGKDAGAESAGGGPTRRPAGALGRQPSANPGPARKPDTKACHYPGRPTLGGNTDEQGRAPTNTMPARRAPSDSGASPAAGPAGGGGA